MRVCVCVCRYLANAAISITIKCIDQIVYRHHFGTLHTQTHTHRSHIHSRTLTCLHTHCHSDTRTPAGICRNEAMDRTGGRLKGRVLGSFLSAFASSLESREPLMSVSNILKTCIPHRKSSCVPVCANVFGCVCRSGTYIHRNLYLQARIHSLSNTCTPFHVLLVRRLVGQQRWVDADSACRCAVPPSLALHAHSLCLIRIPSRLFMGLFLGWFLSFSELFSQIPCDLGL